MATLAELSRDITSDVTALVADIKAAGQLQTFSDGIQRETKKCAHLPALVQSTSKLSSGQHFHAVDAACRITELTTGLIQNGTKPKRVLKVVSAQVQVCLHLYQSCPACWTDILLASAVTKSVTKCLNMCAEVFGNHATRL